MSHYDLLCNDSHPVPRPEDIANVVPQLRTGPIDGGDIIDDSIPADPADEPWRAEICLMATFEHSNITDFSEVHQHFLLPIPPTVGLNSAHFHTNPDWICKGPQWIVAYPLILPLGRSLTQRWRHTSNPA